MGNHSSELFPGSTSLVPNVSMNPYPSPLVSFLPSRVPKKKGTETVTKEVVKSSVGFFVNETLDFLTTFI